MSNANDLIKQKEYRNLLKHLKKKKLFVRFYLACAEAFNYYQNPRDELNHYLANTVKFYIDGGGKNEFNEFIQGIANWIVSNNAKII